MADRLRRRTTQASIPAVADGSAAEALTRAERDPSDEAAWDAVSALVGDRLEPEAVAALFARVLEGSEIAPAVASRVGRRAVQFREEWFGDEPAPLVALLERVIALDPEATWAFDRLTLLLSVGQRWADLLALYDRALDGLADGERRRTLLREAAGVAKDFAGDSERAIRYLDELFAAHPSDGVVVAALERLLERQGDHAARARVWRRRLGVVSAEEAVELRSRLGKLLVDELGDAAGALGEARALAAASGGEAAALELLRRIVALPAASADVRRDALAALRSLQERQGRPGDVVEALRSAAPLAGGAEREAMLRELVDRLVARGDLTAALTELVELAATRPEDAAVRLRLRHLAEQSGRHDLHVQGLLGAAAKTSDVRLRHELALAAADLEHERLGDRAAARDRYERVATDPDAPTDLRVSALRKHEALIDADASSERLGPLEQLAQLEADVDVRRAIFAKVAALATTVGEPDRAVAAWQARLALPSDGGPDVVALDGLVVALEAANRPQELAAALVQRAAVAAEPQRRADLARVAGLQARELGDPASAIETWRALLDVGGAGALGTAEEATSALRQLLAGAQRWQELAALLGSAGEAAHAAALDLALALGAIFADHLDDRSRALTCYVRALALAPAHEGARAALIAVVDAPDASDDARGAAIAALLRAYDATGDAAAAAALLDRRLALTAPDDARAQLLVAAARDRLARSADEAGALSLLARALPLAPANAELTDELVRLARTVGTEGALLAADALAAAAARATAKPARVAELKLLEATLAEHDLHATARALDAYGVACAARSELAAARLGLVRTAARLGRFDVAATALVGSPIVPSAVMGPLLEAFEAAARDAGKPETWATAASALSAAVAAARAPRELARDLELRAADWLRDGAADAAAAEAALARAVAFDPLHRPALERLIQQQRAALAAADEAGARSIAARLVDGLLRLATVAPAELDPLVDAAELARTRVGDRSLAINAYRRTLDRASQLLRAGTPVVGSRAPDATALAALEALAELHVESGDRGEIARAVDLLLDGTRLPLPADTARGLRRRAARLALEALGDKTRARDVLRRVVDDEPADAGSLRTLAALYEEAELFADLLTLRKRELALASDADERVALRLELARVAGIVEARSARIETLVENLQERPGHRPTVRALVDVLSARGKHRELADIVTAQARAVEETGDGAAAAGLWAEVAALAHGPLADPARALAASERMATLDPSPEAFDRLASMLVARDDAAGAIPWLERLLAATAGDSRIAVSERLADAYVAAGQRHRAIACLERALGEDGTAAGVRARLVELYGEANAYEPLARTLGDGLEHLAADPAKLVAQALEAAALFEERLGAPDRAVAVLERAHAAAPSDRTLRTQLARALRRAGRPADARALLEALIADLGRRRSKERASLHHELALAARAAGDLPAALEHLDRAAAIDVDQPEIQLALADAAEAAGDPERAERALRAVLVLARRAAGGDGPSERPLVAETLLRLETLARARGASDAAAECLDSAIATALQNPAEAARLQAALLARGDRDAALALLERRRAAAADARSEAAILCETAELLEQADRAADGLERALRAIDRAPTSEEAHVLARRLATRVGREGIERYLNALTGAVDQRRRWDDGPRVCDLLLRAGEIAERELGDPSRAIALYTRAEQTGARSVEVTEALARSAEAAGDRELRSRALASLAKLAEGAEDATTRAEAGFALAARLLPVREECDRGLDVLARALDTVADFPRALALVRAAGVPDAALHRVMPLYEKVARGSGDDRLLLDFLERRAATDDAKPDEIREAVELAVGLGESRRAERLLERAVSLARRRRDIASGAWALLDLAQRRKSNGDLDGAARALEEAATASDSPRIPALLRELAREADRASDGAALAARIYEGLRLKNPGDRTLWEPLLAIYARMEDRPALEHLVTDTVFRLASRSERSLARMGLARYLAALEGGESDAISTLRDVLLDDPGHREALLLLADLHERGGDVAEAVSLLSEAMKESPPEDDAFRGSLARRLGDLLRRVDPAQARQVYRTALGAPINDHELRRGLRQGLVDMLSPTDDAAERAELLEQLLADDDGERAVARALELADVRRQLGDVSGAVRALELGHERAPDDAPLLARLLDTLRAGGELARVVDVLERAAARASGAQAAIPLLRQAARVARDELGDRARAATLLRRAFTLAPADADLLGELTAALAEIGATEDAIAELARALADDGLPASTRGRLLRARADLAARAGDDAAAVADLEAATAIDGSAAADLAAALERVAANAAKHGDVAAEKRATFRLAELLGAGGDAARADALLFAWAERHPEDLEVMHALRGRAEAAGRWDDVARICARLAELEQGDACIEAALGLAHACEEAGRAGDAIPTLEHLLQSFPAQPALLARLGGLYEAAGERAKLAHLMLEQAERSEDEEARFRAFSSAAELLLSLGDAAAGFAALEKASALRPTDLQVRRLLIDASLAAGLHQEAAQAASDLLGELRGGDPTLVGQLYHRLARAHAGLGDREGQLQALKRALDTDRKNGDVAAEVADVAEELGDDDLALKALRTVTLHAVRGPLTPAVAFFRQARIAFRQGDRQRAMIFAKRALQENPGLDDAQELLRQLR